jgi:hypothetical protein
MNPIADPVSPSLVKVFKDVSVSNHYYKAITDLATRGIIEGTNGSFHPDANVTRAELLKIVFLAGGIAVDSIAEATFSDVSSYDWAYPYVATALKMQAIHGFPDGTFRPNNPVTRAEGCKIIVNLLKKSSLDPVSFPVFSDVKTTDWVHSYANYAKTHDFFVFKNNRFLPQQLLTRGECANAVCNC